MISLKNVSKNFENNQIIKNINLTIKKGEVIGFLGPNGAGKTTTVRMIAGVLPPSKGEILVNEQNLFDNNNTIDGKKKPHIGYLPENNPIFDDLTVEEFLYYWAEIKNIAKDKQLPQIKKVVKETGLQDVFYRPISELSKGYRQRTGLAQAILSDPEILLLDEPTEGLDPNQRRDIHDLIKGIGKERTVIICSHVLSEITKMCNRILIINHGKIVADSFTKDLADLAGGQNLYEILANGKDIKKDLEKLSGVNKVESKKDKLATKFIVSASSKKDLRLPIFELAKLKKWDLYELVKKQEDLEDIFAQLTRD